MQNNIKKQENDFQEVRKKMEKDINQLTEKLTLNNKKLKCFEEINRT